MCNIKKFKSKTASVVAIVFVSVTMQILFTCCSSQAITTGDDTVHAITIPLSADKTSVSMNSGVNYIPKAVVYRTNGDYNNNVMISVGDDGKVISYPAPSDITSTSTPLQLSDGWLLDRRGAVGRNSVFLKYTYAEYAALKQAPSPERLREMILPGAHVTEFIVLPINIIQAVDNTAEIEKYIKER